MDENNNNTLKNKHAPIDVNLPSLPFYRLSGRVSNKPEAYEDDEKTVKIIFGEGKPSAQAQKVLIYLSSKVPRKIDGTVDTKKLREQGVLFTYSEICGFLGIQNETRNRRTIKKDLIKLGYTSIFAHKRYIVKQGEHQGNFIEINGVIPFKIKLYDGEETKSDPSQLPLWYNQIKFDDVIINNLENKVYRLSDVRDIQKIKNPTSLRIFGIISLHNQSKIWKIGLVKLAKQIPVQTKILKNTKKVVKKACDELKELDLILGYSIYTNSAGEEIVQFEFTPYNSFSVRNIDDGHKKVLNLYESLMRGIKLN